MSRDPDYTQDYRERTNQDAVEELHILKTGGICEVAARNPSVMEYMRHWEGRAEKAEAEVERVRLLEAVAEALIEIVEGALGAMEHGVWRDKGGARLKDTPEWVGFYVAHRAALAQR